MEERSTGSNPCLAAAHFSAVAFDEFWLEKCLKRFAFWNLGAEISRGVQSSNLM